MITHDPWQCFGCYPTSEPSHGPLVIWLLLSHLFEMLAFEPSLQVGRRAKEIKIVCHLRGILYISKEHIKTFGSVNFQACIPGLTLYWNHQYYAIWCHQMASLIHGDWKLNLKHSKTMCSSKKRQLTARQCPALPMRSTLSTKGT